MGGVVTVGCVKLLKQDGNRDRIRKDNVTVSEACQLELGVMVSEFESVFRSNTIS